jgi:tetratricopeptide (TPR) repeat protein
MIRVDCPSDVIFLHESDSLLRSTPWYRPVTKTFEELKADGNQLFVDKSFEKAVPIINLKKAAALLPIERYFEAYECALIARGYEEIDQAKVELRLGRAAYGLREWSKAAEHFESLIEMKPELIEAKEFLEKTNRRLDEWRTGRYDMHFLIRNSKSLDIDVSDFVGPIKISEIEGKGRGLVTPRAVSRGTLLLVSKAFAFSDSSINLVLTAIDAIRNVYWPPSQYFALMKSVQKLRKNPQLVNDFYSLFSGESDRGVSVPDGVIDAARIERIHRFNAFGTHDVAERVSEGDRSGIWILPSYINHSCIANVERAHYGDVMMIHAIRDLTEGEELQLPYYFDFDLEKRTKHSNPVCKIQKKMP